MNSRPRSTSRRNNPAKDGDIIERFPHGRERIRFPTVPAPDTPRHLAQLIADRERCLEERGVHPLLSMAAFYHDFLSIHPFRNGNGRVSRLLLLLQSQHQGYEVGRDITLERLIEHHAERYYQPLEQSSEGWHQNRHAPGRTSISPSPS